MELLEQLRTLMTWTAERHPGEDTAVSVPAETVEFDAWAADLTPESYEGILHNLREAGVPAALIMELREALDAGEASPAA